MPESFDVISELPCEAAGDEFEQIDQAAADIGGGHAIVREVDTNGISQYLVSVEE